MHRRPSSSLRVGDIHDRLHGAHSTTRSLTHPHVVLELVRISRLTPRQFWDNRLRPTTVTERWAPAAGTAPARFVHPCIPYRAHSRAIPRPEQSARGCTFTSDAFTSCSVRHTIRTAGLASSSTSVGPGLQTQLRSRTQMRRRCPDADRFDDRPPGYRLQCRR